MTQSLNTNPKTSDSRNTLRSHAEAILAKQTNVHSAKLSPVGSSTISAEEATRLVHELQVYQVELELQNEELRRTQSELEASRFRYFDLYELAPTGYCVISQAGKIDEANLTTAKLLGVDRSKLIHEPFSRFVYVEDQDLFYVNFRRLDKSIEPLSFELRLVKVSGEIVWVQLACVTIAHGEEDRHVRICITDCTERKVVEEKLCNRTAIFEAIADSPLDGILVIDAEGKKVHQNARLLELWGIPPEIAKNPEDAVQAQAICHQTKDPKGYVDRIAYLVSHPELVGRDEVELVDGRVFDRYTVPVRSRNGEDYGRIWTFRDITEQKRAQRFQQESLERLRKISSRLPGAIYQLRMRQDGSYCLPYVSDGLYSLFGIRPENVLEDASAIFELIHPDDLDGLLATIKMSADELAPFRCEFRLPSADGTQRWISANAIPERQPDNSTLWHGYLNDVTASHKAENDLQEAKMRLEEAQALARMGNWTYEIETAKTHWSKQLFYLLGFDALGNEPSDQEIYDLLPMEDAAKLDEAIKAASKDGTPYSVVVGIRQPRSDVRYVRWEGRARRNRGGKIVCLYGTCADVTKEVEREKALQDARNQADAANRAKSEFLANMSHEIRTPLTAILGFADMLREYENQEFVTAQRLNAIDTIASAGQHLLTIINDILDLSKIEADKATIKLSNTPLMEVLSEIERLIRPQATRKGLSLTLKLLTPVPNQILSDPTRLRQILLNLVGNAVKFTERGAIDIIASVIALPENCNLRVDIDDTGPGMTSEQSQSLFHAFIQADNTVTRKHGGTGLGLTISKRLAKLMGGDVTLLRTEPGRGSSFRLSLPVMPVDGSVLVDRIETKTVAEIAPAPAMVELRGRILLAEDGLDNQRLLSFILRKAGATVDVAEDGQVALDMLNKSWETNLPYDLLLTDIQMPVMDGCRLARTIRSQGIKIPIVAVTAHALAEDRQKCLEAGCDDYLSKPVDMHTLTNVCSKWIATQR